jgi:hypothetical protein
MMPAQDFGGNEEIAAGKVGEGSERYLTGKGNGVE